MQIEQLSRPAEKSLRESRSQVGQNLHILSALYAILIKPSSSVADQIELVGQLRRSAVHLGRRRRHHR